MAPVVADPVALENGGMPPVAQGSVALGLLRSARPRQWIKNILVFAAPGAAGVLSNAHDALRVLATFGIWCLVSSGTYLVNDVLDAEADRLHPLKRHRPIASGSVPIPLAISVGPVAMAGGIGLAFLLAGGQLAGVLAIYCAITISYSVRLKHEPVIDLFCVASGFILRAISGGLAVGVPLSNWFLIVASFGSLFLVTGKRSAEYIQLGELRAQHRATLGAYSHSFLVFVRTVAAGATLTAYCLWAFEKVALARQHRAIWFQLSIVPFVLALLLYALHLDAGDGGAPEEIALTDRRLQAVAAIWVCLFAIGVYA